MDRVFSVDEISDQFWLPPPANDQKMNRSESEWAFQRFLQEAEAEASSANQAPPTPALHPIYSGSTIPIDSDQYQELLRSRLNLACAAVALKKAPFVIGKSSAGVAEPESTSQGSADSNSFAQVPGKGSQHKDVGGGPIEVPSLPPIPKKAVAQTKQTTSGSSRDLSDDDEAEGENETTENTDPSDVKKVRRMLSNRESARRSRRRKQAHLTELETQVAQLRVKNLSLSKLLTSISQKYTEAAVDNRVLKADIETLRAKVKMAEETVKRVTGMNQPPTHANPIPTQIQRAENFAAPKNVLPNQGVTKMGRTPSMQRVASLEHLQKKICAGINQIGSKQISDP